MLDEKDRQRVLFNLRHFMPIASAKEYEECRKATFNEKLALTQEEIEMEEDYIREITGKTHEEQKEIGERKVADNPNFWKQMARITVKQHINQMKERYKVEVEEQAKQWGVLHEEKQGIEKQEWFQNLLPEQKTQWIKTWCRWKDNTLEHQNIMLEAWQEGLIYINDIISCLLHP